MTDPIYSSTQAADLVGCNPDTIRRLAKRHGLGHKAGQVLVLHDRDIRILRLYFQSQSRFQPGNELWKKRKTRNPYQS